MINCPWCFLQQTLGFVALAKWVSLLFWNTASTIKAIFTTGSKLSGVFLHWAAADEDHHHHDSGTIFQVLNDRRKLPKLSSFASYCFPAVCDRTAFALEIVWCKIWKSVKTLWTNSTIATQKKSNLSHPFLQLWCRCFKSNEFNFVEYNEYKYISFYNLALFYRLWDDSMLVSENGGLNATL